MSDTTPNVTTLQEFEAVLNELIEYYDAGATGVLSQGATLSHTAFQLTLNRVSNEDRAILLEAMRDSEAVRSLFEEDGLSANSNQVLQLITFDLASRYAENPEKVLALLGENTDNATIRVLTDVIINGDLSRIGEARSSIQGYIGNINTPAVDYRTDSRYVPPPPPTDSNTDIITDPVSSVLAAAEPPPPMPPDEPAIPARVYTDPRVGLIAGTLDDTFSSEEGLKSPFQPYRDHINTFLYQLDRALENPSSPLAQAYNRLTSENNNDNQIELLNILSTGQYEDAEGITHIITREQADDITYMMSEHPEQVLDMLARGNITENLRNLGARGGIGRMLGGDFDMGNLGPWMNGLMQGAMDIFRQILGPFASILENFGIDLDLDNIMGNLGLGDVARQGGGFVDPHAARRPDPSAQPQQAAASPPPPPPPPPPEEAPAAGTAPPV